jgi:hypothetical protein
VLQYLFLGYTTRVICCILIKKKDRSVCVNTSTSKEITGTGTGTDITPTTVIGEGTDMTHNAERYDPKRSQRVKHIKLQYLIFIIWYD